MNAEDIFVIIAIIIVAYMIYRKMGNFEGGPPTYPPAWLQEQMNVGSPKTPLKYPAGPPRMSFVN